MLGLRFAFVIAAVFGVAHYLTSAVASAIGIFVLNWWEPKWGSPWGAWIMDVTAFLPLFSGIATLGAVVAVLAAWRYLRVLTVRKGLVLGILAGSATALVGYALAYTSQHLPNATADNILAITQVWIFVGAPIVWLLIGVWVSRREIGQRAV